MNEAKKIPIGKRMALSVFRQYRDVQCLLHELTYLFWECTLRCNLSCLHCGSDCQKQSTVPDMPLEDFLAVLDDVKQFQDPRKVTIALTGGEPLLRQDLERCGTEIRKRGFPWGMVSNGYSMTQERFGRLLQAGLGSITISLDGLKESHNWLRGRSDSFDRAVESIRFAAATKGLHFDVVTCVNQKNFVELQSLKQVLIDLGVRNWRLFVIFPKGRAKNDRLLDIRNEQLSDLMEFMVANRKEGKIRTSFGCEGFLGSYEGLVRDGFFFCRAGINVGSVLADGSVSACPSLRGDYIQGNIHKDAFSRIWNERFQIMRNRKWLKTGICEECKEFKWCNGNGLHLREEKTGKLLRCHYKMLTGEQTETYFGKMS